VVVDVAVGEAESDRHFHPLPGAAALDLDRPSPRLKSGFSDLRNHHDSADMEVTPNTPETDDDASCVSVENLFFSRLHDGLCPFIGQLFK
jgi:hypothetical protein